MGDSAMTQRKGLTTAAIAPGAAEEWLNREGIPFLRQLTPGTKITVSRATMTPFELQLLPILVAAGIVQDKTVP
jgi:hypothetical protein